VLESLQFDLDELEVKMNSLDSAARTNNISELMAILRMTVPEFKPAYSFEGDAPLAFQRVRPDLFTID
jgi:hypothetical protein